jgi:hypothetical protein
MFRTNQEEGAAVMPLVLCRSAGGPFDDEAFASGWRLGELAATLGRGDVRSVAESIRPVERRQADLIAMARGFTMSVMPSRDPEWLLVEFERMVDEL